MNEDFKAKIRSAATADRDAQTKAEEARATEDARRQAHYLSFKEKADLVIEPNFLLIAEEFIGQGYEAKVAKWTAKDQLASPIINYNSITLNFNTRMKGAALHDYSSVTYRRSPEKDTISLCVNIRRRDRTDNTPDRLINLDEITEKQVWEAAVRAFEDSLRK